MKNDLVRRPGEALFSVLLALGSLGLLASAYDIAGFEALSSPGALPLATAGTMVITSGLILVRTLLARPAAGETVRASILPGPVLIVMALVVGYAVLLRPLGFLPTSTLFVFLAIRFLSGRSLLFCAWVSIVTVAAIYVVFRLVFSVLMPEGIVPEREIIAWVGHLLGGRR